MSRKLRWGCLSTANFARKMFLPAFSGAAQGELHAIASRNLDNARAAAEELGIAKAYGSYEELLADPDIDIIYNPLPNHLHIEWSVRAAEAGKHVLCEKPIAMRAADVDALIAARDRHGVKVGEAFMVRTHPQWFRARELLRSGKIGDLRVVNSFFSYTNTDPDNIRNIPAAGGGALYDIGCYTITTSRFLFESEPRRVVSVVERDPELGTDRLTSAILDYPTGQSIWTVSTQLIPYQRVHALGTAGRIEIEIPFNAPADRPCRLWLDETGALDRSGVSVEEFPVCNQYTVEIDTFSKAVAEDGEVPVPLENARANMAVIDAVFRSAETGTWVTL